MINYYSAQITGCTDPLASNFNSAATINDGSCIYASSNISPINTYTLNSLLHETSGLVKFGNFLYTHNDDTDKAIYQLDSTNGNVLNTYSLQTLTNIDWEELSEDNTHFYLGDFGNNANGNRTNLRIYKIDKVSLLNNTPIIDTIKFSYSNQTTFTATGVNNTDFDCEAFVVSNDSIFLFTKQWVSKKTSMYSLPKTSGTYTANLLNTLDVQGLITGGTLLQNKKMVTLCGYTNLLQPFFYLLYDFTNQKYFSGNKRKVNINLPFHQIEGVTTDNGIKYFTTNEYFTQTSFTTVPQSLNIFDLGVYLNQYIYPSVGLLENKLPTNVIEIYPTFADNQLHIAVTNLSSELHYEIFNQLGEIILNGKILESKSIINLNELTKGIYHIRFPQAENKTTVFIKN